MIKNSALTSEKHAYNIANTLTRQELVTTCRALTTSTSGSLTATLRMQLMLKPYTLSHPSTHQYTCNLTPIKDQITPSQKHSKTHDKLLSVTVVNSKQQENFLAITKNLQSVI